MSFPRSPSGNVVDRTKSQPVSKKTIFGLATGFITSIVGIIDGTYQWGRQSNIQDTVADEANAVAMQLSDALQQIGNMTGIDKNTTTLIKDALTAVQDIQEKAETAATDAEFNQHLSGYGASAILLFIALFPAYNSIKYSANPAHLPEADAWRSLGFYCRHWMHIAGRTAQAGGMALLAAAAEEEIFARRSENGMFLAGVGAAATVVGSLLVDRHGDTSGQRVAKKLNAGSGNLNTPLLHNSFLSSSGMPVSVSSNSVEITSSTGGELPRSHSYDI